MKIEKLQENIDMLAHDIRVEHNYRPEDMNLLIFCKMAKRVYHSVAMTEKDKATLLQACAIMLENY